jgi:hypothetical protein
MLSAERKACAQAPHRVRPLNKDRGNRMIRNRSTAGWFSHGAPRFTRQTLPCEGGAFGVTKVLPAAPAAFILVSLCSAAHHINSRKNENGKPLIRYQCMDVFERR